MSRSTAPAAEPQTSPAEEAPKPPRPTYAVLNAVISDDQGGEEVLRLAMPSEPFGTAAWQMWTVGLYLARLHRHQVQPSAATLRAHLTSGVVPFPTPTARFPYGLLHDSRPTLILDLELGPLDASGWPSTSLVVVEQDTEPYGFTRVRRFRTLRATAKAVRKELDDECSRLAGKEEQRELFELAAKLCQQAGAIQQRARESASPLLGGAARESMHAEGEERERLLLELEEFCGQDAPLPDDAASASPVQTVTGHLERATEVMADGTARLYVRLAGACGTASWRADRPSVVICTARGAAARGVLALKPGTAVVVVGRAGTAVYQHEEDVRRRADTFEVLHIGVDLAAGTPAATA
ncbi:hypothetical protein GCM10010441_29550 [Kitasatospora paracochleata]|uniref:Uncharacterized protein n=1 Tax=Kitasatospora paracochleata TaxID=58354 RepID=A0ABT1JB68_9ACTN|nr:hypothetical protein [Kitasatospora paracochleata]MCP2313916.1 hypothetical protein [Kitasatospora paracochleata]